VDNQCSICLQRLTDRTLIPRCSHEFCFECLGHLDGYVPRSLRVVCSLPSENRHLDQSRRCPLCAQGIGEYLIHNIRSKYDYTKYFLPPLRSNSPALAAAGPSSSNQRRPTRRERRWGQRERREQELQDQLERSIRRKWVYRHHLYAKVSIR
jgi:E3 ubiquitin-protein ligase Topors